MGRQSVLTGKAQHFFPDRIGVERHV